jgi:hypothetical protein
VNRPKTKILVDGGDPQETLRVKELLGFVDGQTTNPSLVANNPHIRQLLSPGNKLSEPEELDEYRKIVQQISPLVGNAGVTIEVFSDHDGMFKRFPKPDVVLGQHVMSLPFGNIDWRAGIVSMGFARGAASTKRWTRCRMCS